MPLYLLNNMQDFRFSTPFDAPDVHPKGTHKQMSPFQMIQSIGGDFLTNSFDAYFLWNPFESSHDDSGRYIPPSMTGYENYILSKHGFAVRLDKITIPHLLNETFEISDGETIITKIRPRKDNNQQTSMDIRIDTDLVWVDEIQLLAGRKNVIDQPLLMHKDEHSPHASTVGKEWRNLFKIVAASFPISKTRNVTDTGLSLVVKMLHLGNWTFHPGQQKVLPYFIFEDIRILGASNSISYNRSGGSPASLSVNFIYKQMHVIDPSFGEVSYDRGETTGPLTMEATNNSPTKLGSKMPENIKSFDSAENTWRQ